MKTQWFVVFALVLACAALAMGAPAQEPKAGEQDPVYAKELEIKELLLEKGGKVAVGIRVTVDGAKAILTGEVPTQAALELAKEVVLAVDGIKSVDNRLKLVPPPGGSTARTADDELADAHLESKVKRRLYSELGKRARQIEVEAVDGIVSLRGTVPDAARKQLALDTTVKTEGVKKIVDLIKVGS